MDMGMLPGIIFKGMDYHYHGRCSVVQIQSGAEKEGQALIHTMAKPAEQLSVIFKEMEQDDWNIEDILAVRGR